MHMIFRGNYKTLSNVNRENGVEFFKILVKHVFVYSQYLNVLFVDPISGAEF